jgi:hypothetical protein
MKTLPEIFDKTLCFLFGHNWHDDRVGAVDTFCTDCGERK